MGAPSSCSTTYGVTHSSARKRGNFPTGPLQRLSPWQVPLTARTHSVIGNYKPTHSIFRQLTHEACRAPRNFAYQNVPPRLHSARVARHPISPIARIWSAVIRNTAAANAALQDADTEWFRADFGEVYTEKDLQIIRESYAEIPAGVRPLLQGRVMHSVLVQAAFWKKRKEFLVR